MSKHIPMQGGFKYNYQKIISSLYFLLFKNISDQKWIVSNKDFQDYTLKNPKNPRTAFFYVFFKQKEMIKKLKKYQIESKYE